jgi:hypothetical protein
MPGIYAPDGSMNVTIAGTGGSSGTSTALTPQSYTLLTNASSTGQGVSNVRGGDYVWRVSGTFGGATVTLQTLDLDGTTWVPVRNQANTADVTLTTAGSVGVGIGQGSTVRVAITGGTGVSLNSTLAGLS